MLLFIDESGHDNTAQPCEVLAGVAVSEDNLWNIVRAVRAAEREHFGDYLRNLRGTELKGKKLLKRKRFHSAQLPIDIDPADLAALAHSALKKGKLAAASGRNESDATRQELVAYSRQALSFVDEVIDIAARHSVQVFASVVAQQAPKPAVGMLRKDYVYLFERYFYYLETLTPRERGLIVFDELDKSQSHILIQQMAAYFLGTQTGRYRSSRIVPEPLFVHSELTTGVFLADIAAYVLAWTSQVGRGPPPREELLPMAKKLHEMQFVGEKPHPDGRGLRRLCGITYLDDLRSRKQRDESDK